MKKSTIIKFIARWVLFMGVFAMANKFLLIDPSGKQVLLTYALFILTYAGGVLIDGDL